MPVPNFDTDHNACKSNAIVKTRAVIYDVPRISGCAFVTVELEEVPICTFLAQGALRTQEEN